MASNTNGNSTAKPTMTDSGHSTTNLPPIPNAEIISLSSVAALPKSEGASAESEPKFAAAASSEVVCVGRNNRAMTWGYSLNKGRRREMEDAITIVPSFMKLPCTAVGGCRAPYCKYAAEESSVHYFGLFDGHGGAQFLSKTLGCRSVTTCPKSDIIRWDLCLYFMETRPGKFWNALRCSYNGNVASCGRLMQSASVARRSFDHLPQDFTPQQLLESLRRRRRQNDESASWERWGSLESMR